ncbi:hypothetical protein PG984_000031 [Apiospora sp. TS-2023a]
MGLPQMEKHEQILRFLAESRPSLLQQVFDHIDAKNSPYEELKLNEDKSSLWLVYHFGAAYEYASFCSATERPLDEYLKVRGHILALLFMWERITDDAFHVFKHGKPRPEDTLPSGLTPKQWLVVRRFILTRAKFGGMIPDPDGKYGEVCVPSEFRKALSKAAAEKAAAEEAKSTAKPAAPGPTIFGSHAKSDKSMLTENSLFTSKVKANEPGLTNSIFGTTKSNEPTLTKNSLFKTKAEPAAPRPTLFGTNVKTDEPGSTDAGNKGKEVI